LNAASGMRAMMAATYGPSIDIISHVAARGSQNQKMDVRVSVRSAGPDDVLPMVQNKDTASAAASRSVFGPDPAFQQPLV
jgi:hypothetical protein